MVNDSSGLLEVSDTISPQLQRHGRIPQTEISTNLNFQSIPSLLGRFSWSLGLSPGLQRANGTFAPLLRLLSLSYVTFKFVDVICMGIGGHADVNVDAHAHVPSRLAT